MIFNYSALGLLLATVGALVARAIRQDRRRPRYRLDEAVYVEPAQVRQLPHRARPARRREAVMAARPARPLLDRLCVMRCRLSYAQQRIRELEQLLAERRIEVPASLTAVPPVTHWCFRGGKTEG